MPIGQSFRPSSVADPPTHLRFSILPGVLGGSGTVKEGARGLPMAVALVVDMFSLPAAGSTAFDPAVPAAPAPEEGLAGLLAGLAPGEASAANREAFMAARRVSIGVCACLVVCSNEAGRGPANRNKHPPFHFS